MELETIMFVITNCYFFIKNVLGMRRVLCKFEHYSQEKVRINLSIYNCAWFCSSSNVDVAWDILFNQILLKPNLLAPSHNNHRRVHNPWITEDLFELSRETDRLFDSDNKSSNKAKWKCIMMRTSIAKTLNLYLLNKFIFFRKGPPWPASLDKKDKKVGNLVQYWVQQIFFDHLSYSISEIFSLDIFPPPPPTYPFEAHMYQHLLCNKTFDNE